MALDSIRTLMKPDLEATDHFILTTLNSDILLINQLVEYILRSGGKRIRPLLVLLTARAFGHAEKEHITLAAAIELIHTATLLHDDVVDHSTLRRGHETANARFGNEASVLVGDFLYSRAFQLVVQLQNLKIINIFAESTNLIAEGEVLQLVNCNNPDTSEAAYFEVIERKTAKLFEVATTTGTTLMPHTPQQLKAMQEYGLSLGIAYQLVDDALDYQSNAAVMGKNKGNDLAEGKPTLPLIHALRHANAKDAALIRSAIQHGETKHIDPILNVIESTQAIEYTLAAAKKHAKKAIDALTQIPETPYRQALHDLATFVVARDH